MKKALIKKVCMAVALFIGIVLILSAAYIYYKKADFMIPETIRTEYNLNKEKYKHRDVYILANKANTSNMVILYLHGGAYTTNINETYWNFFADIVKDTGATMVIPDYPLAPEFDSDDVFSFITPLYEELIEKIGEENLILMGDSAGGGLGLALCQHEGQKGNKQPSKLILISPWLDVSMTNPEIDKVQEQDPLLNKDLLKIAGQIYARDKSTKDPWVSPLYGQVDKLENIIIFSGTNDILNPDTKKFVEQAKKQGIDIDYRETEGAIHIWILSNRDDSVYMAKQDYQELLEIIKEG